MPAGSLSGPQKICLSMIVKNENGPHLFRCIESVRPFISSWAVVDTGSTDGTQETVRMYLEDIPGELIEREWADDFSCARNQALELARKRGAAFAMVLDADDYVVANQEDCPPLQPFETDVVSLAGMDEGEGRMLLLATFIRLGAGLRFHGRVHELVVRADWSFPFGVCEPAYFTRRTRDGAASANNLSKLAYYRELLLRSVSENARDHFAWEALARDALAAMDGLAARGYLEEALRYIPPGDLHREYILRLSRISTFQPFSDYFKEVAAEVKELMLLCPGRAEAPRWLARMVRNAGHIELANQFDAIADEKSVPVGVYGVDHASYRHSSTTPLALVANAKRTSSVKYIVLPDPVVIDNFSWTFSNCVNHVVDNADVFAKPASMIRAGQRILEAIDKAVDEHKSFVELRDEDYMNLKQSFEEPANGYGVFQRHIVHPETKIVIGHEPVRVAPRKFLPFIDAVENATDSPPAVQ
jgi:glycosyltransferase involved in cell wall biosynthesis